MSCLVQATNSGMKHIGIQMLSKITNFEKKNCMNYIWDITLEINVHIYTQEDPPTTELGF